MPEAAIARSSGSRAAGVRPAKGSTWSATRRPAARAARATSGSRAASGETCPHHDTITVWTPIDAISRICARTTAGSDDEYGPRAGNQFDAICDGGALPFCCQCCQAPSRAARAVPGVVEDRHLPWILASRRNRATLRASSRHRRRAPRSPSPPPVTRVLSPMRANSSRAVPVGGPEGAGTHMRSFESDGRGDSDGKAAADAAAVARVAAGTLSRCASSTTATAGSSTRSRSA